MKTTILVSLFCLNASLGVGGQTATLQPVGSLGGRIGRMTVQGQAAFIGQGWNLRMFDVADPLHPQLASSLSLTGEVVGVLVRNQVGYVALRNGGFCMVNLANPLQPTLAGACPLLASAEADIAVSGNHAYIAVSDRLSIIDVSNPAVPQPVSIKFISAYDVGVTGNRLYTVAYDGLGIYDLSNPASPTLLGATNHNGSTLLIQDPYMFLGHWQGLKILDVSNPQAIQLLTDYPAGGSVGKIAVHGSHAYVSVIASGSNLFKILNVANPAQPVEVSCLNVGSHIDDLEVFPPWAFLTQPSGLVVLNIADPANPTQAGELPGPSSVSQTFVTAPYLYAAEDKGLWIYGLEPPANPVVAGFYSLLGLNRIFVEGPRLYASLKQTTAVQILDVADPAVISPLGTYDPKRSAVDLAARGNQLFLLERSSPSSWLEVVDVANPTAPLHRGECLLPAEGQTLCVAGDIAYVGCGVETNGSLVLMHVANPAAPQQVGAMPVAGRPQCLWSASNQVLVGSVRRTNGGNWSWWLEAFDVSNPVAPVMVASTNGPGTIWGVQERNGFVFAGIKGGSVYLYSLVQGVFGGLAVCSSPGTIGLATTTPNASGIGYVYTPEGDAYPGESRSGYLGMAIQEYNLGSPPPTPVLTLSGAQALQQICPGASDLSNEVQILAFTLSADAQSDWSIHSVQFVASGAGGHEANDIAAVELRQGNERLSQSVYAADDGTVTLAVGRTVPAGGSLPLRLIYRFDSARLATPPFPKLYSVQTSVARVSAEPTDPRFTQYLKLPETPVFGGPVVVGPVWNQNTQEAFETIQQAVDDADTQDGHTLTVCPGTYVENVVVTKSLDIRSIAGVSATIVQAKDTNAAAVRITRSDTRLEGFTIQGSTQIGVKIGSEAQPVEQCELANNRIILNWRGVEASQARHLLFKGNSVFLNQETGVFLDHVSSSVLSNNVLSANGGHGLHVRYAQSNAVYANKIGLDAAGTAAWPNKGDGVRLDSASHHLVGGLSRSQHGNTISGNTGAGLRITGGESNLVQGNFIGTTARGDTALGNGESGICLEDGARGNCVGGEAVPGQAPGNVISANGGDGIEIFTNPSLTPGSTFGNWVMGNIVGLNALGTAPLANGSAGIRIGAACNNYIGVRATNVISGNRSSGIAIVGNSTSNNVVQKNLIGASLSGSGTNCGNGGAGVEVSGASGNSVGGAAALGQGNVIKWNGGSGVAISDTVFREADRNAILGNVIQNNRGLEIDLLSLGIEPGPTPNDFDDADSGGNQLQNYPVLEGVQAKPEWGTVVKGHLDSLTNAQFLLQFFHNSSLDGTDHGEAEKFWFEKRVRTDPSGYAAFCFASLTPLPIGHFISATATDSDGNTSEFSGSTVIELTHDGDFDGTIDLIEAGAPNQGDANRDGIPDSQQDYVVSTPTSADQWLTLVAPTNAPFIRARAVENPSPTNAPPGVQFPLGLLDFALRLTTPGTGSRIEFLLPDGVPVNAYYKFGPTPDNPTNHWYRFDFDGQTGAIIESNKLVLYLVDGQRGDDDVTADGFIYDVGGPAWAPTLRIFDPQLLANGSFRFRLSTLPGQSYCLEVSEHLTNWIELLTTNALGDMLQIEDATATPNAQRFYRVRSP